MLVKPDQYPFVYPEQHEKAGQPIEGFGDKPFILSYDTKSMKVEDFAEFDIGFDVATYKAIAINTIDNFLFTYAKHLDEIVGWSHKAHQKLAPGEPLMDKNVAMNLAGRAQTRVEQFYNDTFNAWTGHTVSLMLPYAQLVYAESKKKDEPDFLDLGQTKPFVNGMMFMFHFRNK